MARLFILFLFLNLTRSGSLFANNDSDQHTKENEIIVTFDMLQEINPSAFRNTKKAFEFAHKNKASAIIINMNTYGGTLIDADSIRTMILNSTLPVYVLIKPNAASAGALISISCNKIYMAKGASIGAATVVNQNAEALPDKYQSYMRAMMRSTAIERGRNPDIAEAMVDQNLEVENVSPKGQVLTFTREEASESGFCDGFAESLEEVLEKEGHSNYTLQKLELTALDKFINWLINPFVHGILILIILGGIYYEMQSPGIGFPLMASVIAAILYFAPLYIEQLAAQWEILIFIIGIILIGLEIFVIPGFGIAGIAGISLLISGLILSMLRNIYFDFTFTGADAVIEAFIVVISSFTITLLLMFTTGGRIIRSHLFQRLVLTQTLSGKQSVLPKDISSDTKAELQESPVAKYAVAYTKMYPSGKIIFENNIYEALSEGEFLEKGDEVIILKDLGNKFLVRKKG
jgi:membrane-bound serine protease (ClpP class)